MKKIITILSLSALSLATWSCISSPMQGFLFTSTNHHIYSGSAGSQLSSASILKSGKSCSFGSFPFLTLFYYGGGGSIREAAKAGGIKKIAVVDRSSMNIIGPIFYRECVVVWGE